MRLIAVQKNRLPCPQRVVYIKSDFYRHGHLHMPPPSDRPEPEGKVADAVSGNWVDSLAPEASRPFLRLSRADRPIGTWLLLLPCWWGLTLAMLSDGNSSWHDLWIFMGCGGGAWLMRGAQDAPGMTSPTVRSTPPWRAPDRGHCRRGKSPFGLRFDLDGCAGSHCLSQFC